MDNMDNKDVQNTLEYIFNNSIKNAKDELKKLDEEIGQYLDKKQAANIYTNLQNPVLKKIKRLEEYSSQIEDKKVF